MYPMKFLLRTLAGLAISASLGLHAIAGPSFNPDRDELAQLSGEAGAELHVAFARFHDMLQFLERRDVGRANEAKADALKHFKTSATTFEKVAETAPNQKIVFIPKSPGDEAALDAFKRRLAEQKIPIPSTERELAKLAVKAVSEHAAVLEKSNFRATKADYAMLREVLKSQAIVLDLGILSSIVWTVSVRQ